MNSLNLLASNKIFLGVTLIIMNMGSRFVIGDVTKVHEKLLSNEVVKKIVVFCIFFVTTRDIMISIILTFAFIVVLDGLMNEKSRFNLLPNDYKKGPTKLQYQEALEIIEKYKNIN